MTSRDPRVDAYIARSAPFARPILARLRDVVHRACPDVQETMKWSMPHFDYKGIMCGMAAFKGHATFWFWKGTLIPGLEARAADGGAAMGHLGKLTSAEDLPTDAKLAGFVKAAMRLNDDGVAVARPKRAPKPEPALPPALGAALAKNRRAKSAFEAFSPGQRREYVDWIADAKREETREKRVAQAVEWIAEGKSRNWKYQKGGA